MQEGNEDQFWLKSIGPIFLYTGNEADIWDFAKNCGFISELAAEQQALVIFAEHRYYGKSLPFGKKSYERINIEFLTVEQAIADYVLLVTKVKSELDAENCPVIAFGGSYGGMLSAYIRIKYPNIVEGALASSAPVMSAANIGDSRQFFHDVTTDFERVSPDCVSKIREAFQELEKYTQQQAWNKIGNELSLCKPLKSKKEVDHLYGWARNAFTYLAMFNYPYETEMGLHFPANPVDVSMSRSQKPVSYESASPGMFYNSTGTKKCFDIYTEYQHCADPTGCGLGSGSQAWDFQVCTEVNLLYETNNETDMFPVLPFTEEMRRSYCHSKWGVYPNTEWLKIQYWGEDFKAASNIIFSNGDLDPWANGGVLRNMTPSVVAYIIEGGAHHLDLRASNPADPQSVTIIRKRESSIISEWVKKYQRHSV
ncbi:dipeptidyl peptidase 2 [Mobula birostris]|uniref:dipeptidyl peptidase 2 n=1 Tax=Mobula birostris TaxID=1983395 RepID=UPI003B28C930